MADRTYDELLNIPVQQAVYGSVVEPSLKNNSVSINGPRRCQLFGNVFHEMISVSSYAVNNLLKIEEDCLIPRYHCLSLGRCKPVLLLCPLCISSFGSALVLAFPQTIEPFA